MLMIDKILFYSGIPCAITQPTKCVEWRWPNANYAWNFMFSIFSLLIDFAQQKMSDTEADSEMTNHRSPVFVHRSTLMRLETKCEDCTFDFLSFVNQRHIYVDGSSILLPPQFRFFFFHCRKSWMFSSVISISFKSWLDSCSPALRFPCDKRAVSFRIIEYEMSRCRILIGSHRLWHALYIVQPCSWIWWCHAKISEFVPPAQCLSMLINVLAQHAI